MPFDNVDPFQILEDLGITSRSAYSVLHHTGTEGLQGFILPVVLRASQDAGDAWDPRVSAEQASEVLARRCNAWLQREGKYLWFRGGESEKPLDPPNPPPAGPNGELTAEGEAYYRKRWVR